MKKIYSLLLLISIIGTSVFIGCRKEPVYEATTNLAPVDAATIAKDASFIALNESLDRFDPAFLLHTYKDKRKLDEIIAQSNDLLSRIKKDPENPLLQKELMNFYHFKDVTDLKNYAGSIIKNIGLLNTRYGYQNTFLSPEGSHLYYRARVIYAGNKLKRPSTKTNGIWAEFVEDNLSSFNYYDYIYNEGLETNTEQGGGGCNEICCWEKLGCEATAHSNFIRNSWSYGLGGAGSLATGGAAAGSGLPGIGTVAGGIVGAIWGASLGIVAANTIYRNDLYTCKVNYIVCLLKKEKQ